MLNNLCFEVRLLIKVSGHVASLVMSAQAANTILEINGLAKSDIMLE